MSVSKSDRNSTAFEAMKWDGTKRKKKTSPNDGYLFSCHSADNRNRHIFNMQLSINDNGNVQIITFNVLNGFRLIIKLNIECVGGLVGWLVDEYLKSISTAQCSNCINDIGKTKCKHNLPQMQIATIDDEKKTAHRRMMINLF